MTNFWQALDQIQPAVGSVKLEYRLYYNDLGEPLFYSTDNEPGNYITVDKETYDTGRYDVRVSNDRLIKPAQYIYQKLIPVTLGIDVSIVLPGQTWKLKRYE